MKQNLQTEHNKKAMIEALKASLGVVQSACEAVGIARVTHYEWMKDDPDYCEKVTDIKEIAIDFAESKLHESIDNGSDTAIIFYLKCQAKKRGYIDRQEIDVTSGGEPLKLTVEIVKP